MTIAWLFTIAALTLWLAVTLLVWLGTDRKQWTEDEWSGHR